MGPGTMDEGGTMPTKQRGHKGGLETGGGRKLWTGSDDLIPPTGTPGEDGDTPDLSPAAIPLPSCKVRA